MNTYCSQDRNGIKVFCLFFLVWCIGVQKVSVKVRKTAAGVSIRYTNTIVTIMKNNLITMIKPSTITWTLCSTGAEHVVENKIKK